MNPCDIPYTPCHDPENEAMRLKQPIEIETPWLKISKIKLKKYGDFCSHFRGRHRLTFYFDHAEAPEYTARVSDIDRPPVDAPSASKSKYVQTIICQLRLNLKPCLEILSPEDIDHGGALRQTVVMNGKSIKAGDKMKWRYSVLGYGRKCLRLNTHLDECLVRHIDANGEVKEEKIATTMIRPYSIH